MAFGFTRQDGLCSQVKYMGKTTGASKLWSHERWSLNSGVSDDRFYCNLNWFKLSFRKVCGKVKLKLKSETWLFCYRLSSKRQERIHDFPLGAPTPFGGRRRCLTWALFGENVCENERIGPIGRGWGVASANAFPDINYHCLCLQHCATFLFGTITKTEHCTD